MRSIDDHCVVADGRDAAVVVVAVVVVILLVSAVAAAQAIVLHRTLTTLHLHLLLLDLLLLLVLRTGRAQQDHGGCRTRIIITGHRVDTDQSTLIATIRIDRGRTAAHGARRGHRGLRRHPDSGHTVECHLLGVLLVVGVVPLHRHN